MVVTMPARPGTKEQSYKALTVRIPEDLVEHIKLIAEVEERSINYITARLLREALATYQRDPDDRT